VKIPEPNTDYELLPIGTYATTCVEFIDFGTQPTTYGPKRQVRLGWEIDKPMTNGKPFIASRLFTFSSHEKASFRKIVEGMLGQKLDKAFDTKSLLGRPCLIAIQHNESGDATFANVETVMPLPAGTKVPGPVMSKPIYFSLDTAEFNETIFRELSEKRQTKIGASPEWMNLVSIKALKGQSPSKIIGGDEIPF
jgi:hypothetical protein